MQTQEIVDLDRPKSSFKGSLIICPTPIGNMKDISLRVLEALNTADIIACEDTRMAGKLFQMLRDKKIKEQFQELVEVEESAFEDETIFGERAEETREHPNMFEIKREKRRLREMYQKEEYKKMVAESRNVLKDLDTFRHHFSKERGEQEDSAFYDTQSKRPRDKTVYGLDNPYIEYLKQKVYESKLRYKR